LRLTPDQGTVSPGGVGQVQVDFDTTSLSLGTYEAEILVNSNDPFVPSQTIPVTMHVIEDNLKIVPHTPFDPNGIQGGPFAPTCHDYNLINTGTIPLNWLIDTAGAPWLQVQPTSGVLDPCGVVEVRVCLTDWTQILDPCTYRETVVFHNVTSGHDQHRHITLTVYSPNAYTELFEANDNDLEGLMLTFQPDGSVAYYSACREESVTEFPVDPCGGNPVTLADDDFIEVILSDGATISFYGRTYDRFYLGSNGYLTFGRGDSEYLESPDNHFNLPRISALFTDLTPLTHQAISWKQLPDRAVVTYENVPVYGDKTATNSFQVEMFFVDGTIRISWPKIGATGGCIGLSRGDGLPYRFTETDLSGQAPCCPLGDFNGDCRVDLRDFVWLADRWMDKGCDIPDWCAKTDLDRNHCVDTADLTFLLGNWLIDLNP